MRSLLSVLALALALTTSAMAGNPINPTTTLAAETGNNTSTANTFKALSNGDLGATNISKQPISSLLYSGATTKVYVHWMPWFGTTSHMNVGYDSADPAQIARQVNDMMSRGVSGAIVDWYGPKNTHHNTATINLKLESEKHPGQFYFAITEDVGALKTCAATAGCDLNQQVISDLTYAYNTFETSPAYLYVNGRPAVFFFGLEKYSLDWNVIRAGVPGNPLFIFRNSGAFSKTPSDGGFSWVGLSSDPNNMGLSYLDNFYATALKYPAELPVGSGYAGFNDTLASWGQNRILNQQCGQTWLTTLKEAGKYYSATNQLPFIQVVTWNDYEEGSEIESGIDNCVSVSALTSGNVVTWSITGMLNTIDHFTVFISLDGLNLMPVADVPATASSLDLSTFGFDAGNYTLYVKAVGKPTLTNKMSNAVSWSLINQAPVAKMSLTPTSGIAPVSVAVDASASTDPDGSIAATSIDFGDGTVLSGSRASHTYSAAGNYTITTSVTDNLGATNSSSASVTVAPNQPPQAQLTVTPASGIGSVTVNASAAASTDADGAIASTVINWGDGSAPLNAISGSHTYNAPGVYTVTATVTDNLGATSSATVNVTVTANQPPVAKLSVTPTSGIGTVTVSASTSGSSDPDGSIASTVINWGDGSAALTGISGSHTYSVAGTYTVTATVTDNLGATSSATSTVTVTANQPPVAKLSVTPTTGIGTVTVSASTSGSSDPDGSIASTVINWGDGSAALSGTSGSHTYSVAGVYTVTATVTDNLGAKSSVTAVVTVTANQSPVAKLSVTPTSGTASLLVNASTSGSSDPDGTIASTVINWGDGTAVLNGTSGSHTYTAAGSYTVTATVTDNLGAKSSASVVVTVTSPNSSPVAKLTVTPTTGPASLVVTASTTGSYDPDGTISSTSISWGDGTASSNLANASHTYTKAGVYTVTATVTDNKGAKSSASVKVTVYGVNIQSPTANATVSSPVHVVATAVSSSAITCIKVYVDGAVAYSINNASKIDTYVKMATGTRRITVQSWDSKGVVYKSTVYVTVK